MEDNEEEAVVDTVMKEEENKEDVVVVEWFLSDIVWYSRLKWTNTLVSH